MPLTWTPVEQITNDLFNPTHADFSYGPDGSVVFIYDIDDTITPFGNEVLGVFLVKRKRDGTYLTPMRVDDQVTDVTHIDYVTDTTLRARIAQQWRSVIVDKEGSIHCLWTQPGRNATNPTFKEKCYRKFAFDGDEDSYGTPSDVYYTTSSSTLTDSGCLAVNPIDGTVWFTMDQANTPKISYIVTGDTAGAIDAFRTHALAFATGSSISATQGTFIDFDANGNLHYVQCEQAGWAMTYGYRLMGSEAPSVSNPTASGWVAPEEVLATLGTDTRLYTTMKARGPRDVLIAYCYHVASSTNDQIRVVTPGANFGWGEVQIQPNTSSQRTYACLDGAQHSAGGAVVAWFDGRAGADEGVWYSVQSASGTWADEAKAADRDTSGSKLLTHVRLNFKTTPRTVFQLGYLNKKPGFRLGVSFTQRDA